MRELSKHLARTFQVRRNSKQELEQKLNLEIYSNHSSAAEKHFEENADGNEIFNNQCNRVEKIMWKC